MYPCARDFAKLLDERLDSARAFSLIKWLQTAAMDVLARFLFRRICADSKSTKAVVLAKPSRSQFQRIP